MIRQVLIIVMTIALIGQLRAERYALLISIANYQDENITSLSSTNDAIHLKEALRFNGFMEDHIIHLNDQDASKKEIIHTFYNILMPLLQSGDQVYFHFSGHGQQIFDTNGDEIDGYDESILAYDAKPKYLEGGYQGEKHIRDDELEEIFNLIRAQLGEEGQLVVVFDSCHSGTMPRGIKGTARGILSPFQPHEYQNRKSMTADEFFVDCDSIGVRAMAPIISIAASSPYELNRETIDFEGNGIGSLSFAIFNALGRRLTDFGDLFQEIRFGMMTLNQTPAIEGDLETSVFGNQAESMISDFRISSIDENTITIDGGQLQGLHVGCIVSFINSKTEKLLLRDTIEHAALTYSTVIVNKNITDADLYRSKVIVIKKQYTFKLPISLGKISATTHEKITDFIDDNNQFLYSDNSAYHIIESQTHILDLLHGAKLLETFDLNTQDNFQLLFDRISSIYHLEFFRQLEERNEFYNIKADIKLLKNPSKKHVFRVGDQVELLIQNKGTKSAYFNLIEIYPDSLDYILSDQNPQDLFMTPGQTKSYPITIQEPASHMAIKVFSSIEPIYFGVERTRGGPSFLSDVIHPVSRGLDLHDNHLTYGIRTLEYEIVD